MKFYAIVSFALFALASAELRKVPRANRVAAAPKQARQNAVDVQVAAMTDVDGNVVPFNTADVNLPMQNGGL
ncbi:hypothetical protein DL768_005826 [Monosporascus sp. mg162]|nr:hypothetical protein DL768_005826 [Monosporascus sp. mg162]